LRQRTGYNKRRPVTEAQIMSITITGFVKNGVVVPNAPLPEGTQMAIRVNTGRRVTAPHGKAKGEHE
jgi:hypothetical protein